MPKRPCATGLTERLQDHRHAVEYLNAALEDSREVFLLALRDVADARGGMNKIARTCKLSSASLNRILSKRESPRIQNLRKLLAGMGFHLAVTKKEAVRRPRNLR